MIIARVQRLADREVEVEVYWVLGHPGVEDNEQENRTAKAAAEGIDARRCTERFTSLAHINRIIMKRKWKEAKHRFKAKH